MYYKYVSLYIIQKHIENKMFKLKKILSPWVEFTTVSWGRGASGGIITKVTGSPTLENK